MKRKIFSLLIVFVMILSLCSCSFIQGLIPGGDPSDNNGGNEAPDGENPDGENPDGENPDGENPECSGHVDLNNDNVCDRCGQQIPVFPDTDLTPVIFLAGDSTVKTYEDGQYIGGWGQFLDLFLANGITVKNAAHGGRSSRSFINEGRLYDIEGSSYTFSQNGGNSIGDEIKAGDYLFIQFGHNDDASKISNYSTIYDRMVPLGEPDANGIYPVTAAERTSTSVLPEEYTSKATDSEEATALSTIAKYGSEYYAYGSGTYKWYLKQYIDFAREKGAIPVLVTPVARVKFSGDKIIGGAGLHGENFAYVEAVRQLASEEECLLIDLFADSKTMLETATSSFANYLMALKPNELKGEWPVGYDSAYGNTEAGYTGIEATHYNKYGAFLQAAFIAEHILENKYDYSFSDHVYTHPESYIDPSNLIANNTINLLECLFDKVSVTNPDRAYTMPETVVALIDALAAKGEVTEENYLEIGKECEAIRLEYARLNVDFKHLVTNISVLEEYEERVEALIIASRPEPTKVVIFKADDLKQDNYDSTVTEGDFTLVATADKAMSKKSKVVTFSYANESYTTTHGLSLGGKAAFGSNRYVSFTVEGPCTVTVAAQSSGSSDRVLSIVDSANAQVGSFDAPASVSVTSVEIDKAGSYSIGSAGSGIYIYMIIIEYFE